MASPLKEIQDARLILEQRVSAALSEFLSKTGGVEITEIDIRLLTHRSAEGGSRAVVEQLVSSVNIQVKV